MKKKTPVFVPLEKATFDRVIKEADQLPASDRRSFLKKASALAAGGAVAGLSAAKGLAQNPDNLPPNIPSWTKQLGSGVVTTEYGLPSEYESGMIRRYVPWLTGSREESVSFTPITDLQGIITPNGVCFERHHAGITQIVPSDHRLMIHGLVERPLLLSMDDIVRLPSRSQINFLECAANGGMEWRGAQMERAQFSHGMIMNCEWTGVPLSVLLDEAGVKADGKWILVEGADAAGLTRTIPIEKADECLVAWAQNGEMLRPEQGYPIRICIPGFEGNMWIKWLRRIEVGDMPWQHREETSKYTDLMPDGKAKFFTWVMDAKSVITTPAPENPLEGGPGFREIRGFAWSGRGKIKAVDVSTDGGISWQTARLDPQQVFDKSMTRFTLPWRWDGSPAYLMSRAIDETGFVQPTIAQLREARGTNSIYHNNAIQTWEIKENGEVFNVQLA